MWTMIDNHVVILAVKDGMEQIQTESGWGQRSEVFHATLSINQDYPCNENLSERGT